MERYLGNRRGDGARKRRGKKVRKINTGEEKVICKMKVGWMRR